MASPSQIEANRRNALLSTGPRTPEGKAAARFNALRHGIYARVLVIPGELEADLDDPARGYYELYRPETPVALYLVDTLIQCDWVRRRLMRMQATLFRAFAPEECTGPDPIAGGDRLQFPPGALNHNLRQLSAIERSYHRALAGLRALAAQSPGGEIGFVPENPQSVPAPQPLAMPPAGAAPPPVSGRNALKPAPRSRIGFVPSNPGAAAMPDALDAAAKTSHNGY